jgi:SAM-dependent methyltransferase
MSKISGIADAQYVTSQYQNAANLNTRIGLHQQFSVNPYGWQSWVFDQLEFPPQSRILELGCGTGRLWLDNIDRIPAGWEITLTDFSAGMLQQAQENLGSRHSFRFQVVDARCIPFESGSFDGVLANHMLYHVPDKVKALGEIQRVLRPEGRFYASTVGQRHLQEIGSLLSRFDPRLDWWGAQPGDSFTLEDGAALLAGWFAEVTLRRYEDALIVTEPVPLIEFILSGRVKLDAGQQVEFARFVQQEFARLGGRFHITKDSGIFISRHRSSAEKIFTAECAENAEKNKKDSPQSTLRSQRKPFYQKNSAENLVKKSVFSVISVVKDSTQSFKRFSQRPLRSLR